MKKIIYFGILIFMIHTNAFCQKISGRVTDEAGTGIGYVNIGIMNSTIGVISDSLGYFTLTLPDSVDSAMEVSFSHISYTLQNMKVFEINDIVSSGKNLKILLVPRYLNIEEIVVLGNKKQEYKYARKGMPAPGYAYPSVIGEEIGSVIDISGEIILSKINFKVLKNTYDRVRIRINVYQIDSDTDSLINIVQVPIYCDILTTSKSREFSLAPNENLTLNSGQYFVSLEFVELEGEGQLRFPVFLHKSYTRQNSMGAIQKFPVNIGLSVKGYSLSNFHTSE